jgi:hypothetical protein
LLYIHKLNTMIKNPNLIFSKFQLQTTHLDEMSLNYFNFQGFVRKYFEFLLKFVKKYWRFVQILVLILLSKVTKKHILDITWTLWWYLINQESIHILGELKKMFHPFSNSINCKSLHKMEWNLKRISNLIQKIKDYGVKNKHDLT